MVSLVATVVIFLVIKSKIYQRNKRNFILISFIFLFAFLFFVLTNDYEYLSTELVYEATLHQDFYSDANSYKSFVKIRRR